MDWPRVKTILIVGFALLNGMLVWQVYGAPDPRQPPQFLAEPTSERVMADLAAIGWELKDDEIPATPADLPLLAAVPRPLPNPAVPVGQFFGDAPPPSQPWQADTGQLYVAGERTLILAPGLLQLVDPAPGVADVPVAADLAEVGRPCPARSGAPTGDGAFIDTMVDQGREFIAAHGGLPADVTRRGDPFPRREGLRVWFPQVLPGGTLIFNGYVEVCMTAAGVTRYTRLLWDMGELLDQGGAVMPAAVLLSREASPGGTLYWAARGNPDEQLAVQAGYIVVPFKQRPKRTMVPSDGLPPAYVAVPVWRLQWGPDQWFDYDVITGKRLD